MTLLEELEARGLIADCTDREGLGKLLESDKITFYCGYDPTATSLHAGNLVPISLAARIARAGHRYLALSGGATGMVGDPSGKTSERPMLDDATRERNLAGIRAQIQRFISADAVMVNNYDWFAPITFLEFLRDVGKHITVNYMLAKESVRARLEEREQGISYTEFSYMLLQAYDFVHLARTQGCRLQIAGADQWGNITCGVELYRKMQGMEKPPIYGLVAPLLLNAAGVKFGKSEGQNVWLDPAMTSPYQFHQFWLNTDDADVAKYLKMFTFVPLDEIDAVMREHDPDRAKRLAQRRLAREVTTWVHGEDEARRAEGAKVLFAEGGAFDAGTLEAAQTAGVPTVELPRDELRARLPVADLLVRAGLADSKSEARRVLTQGGVYVNKIRIDDPGRTVGEDDLATNDMILLRVGKKRYCIVRAVG